MPSDNLLHRDEILEMFSYSEDEQRVFPFLGKYMEKINPKLPQLLVTPIAQERFMLAGLFLPYLAFRHLGLYMTTEIDETLLLQESANNVHIQRIKTYKRFTGNSIRSDLHYIWITGFNRVKAYLLRPENMLYRFVTKGNRQFPQKS